jgi:hypothetical protein
MRAALAAWGTRSGSLLLFLQHVVDGCEEQLAPHDKHESPYTLSGEAARREVRKSQIGIPDRAVLVLTRGNCRLDSVEMPETCVRG